MPPHTTKRRPTTNLKTKIYQNCREIKLYGSPTTKEFNNSSRPVGGAETGSRAERTHSKVETVGSGWARLQLVDRAVPHSHETDRATQGANAGK